MSRIENINFQINKLKSLKAVQKSGYMAELSTLSDRLNDKVFRLAVVGEFSSGKSTFINAIIGKDVLKHAATETTATVTYIYNVPVTDNRLNTCVIEYIDGNTVNLSDLDKLREYTTVNSEINVAESIKSVSIYVSFLNVDYPIVITDTPGLNGIADKHREITLNEIKKAHACIYLLSGNGLKSTDFDFIRILLNYQRKFIFIQNFIDLLRVSEGETVQSKIAKDRENLNICFGEDNSEISYQLYGISAVKALAARDLNKDRVFEEDTDNITDREKLFEESNFSEFESSLYRIVETGEHLEVIENSVSYTLKQITERIKNNLDEECKLNEQLKSKDDKSIGIEKAKKIISRINSQKEDQKKRLENFLISRDSENRRSLHDYNKRCLEKLLENLDNDLDEKARRYEEFITFANYYGAEPPMYYGKYIYNYINGHLVPDVDKRIQNNLSHLYDEAILKVSNFVTTVPETKEHINIEVNNNTSGFNESEIQSDFEKYKKEVEIKRLRINSLESSVKNMISQNSDVEREIDYEKERSNIDRQKYEREKQKIGVDPGVKTITVEKTITKERDGWFGGLIDCIFGEITETKTVCEPDYSEQNEWKRRKNILEEQNRRIIDSHNQRMSSLENRKKQIQDDIMINSNAIERLQKDIIDLEERIKQEQEIYERTLKINRQEYCDNEKRKLKEEFSRVLLDRTNNNSALEKINKHIDDIDLKYLPIIQDKVLKYYSNSVQMRIEGLNELIQSNETESEAKYELSKKELAVLDEIIKSI